MTDDLVEFLQHAVRLESDAAEGYQRLAAVMRDREQPDLAVLFERFGEFSRLHLAEARARLEERWPSGPRPCRRFAGGR